MPFLCFSKVLAKHLAKKSLITSRFVMFTRGDKCALYETLGDFRSAASVNYWNPACGRKWNSHNWFCSTGVRIFLRVWSLSKTKGETFLGLKLFAIKHFNFHLDTHQLHLVHFDPWPLQPACRGPSFSAFLVLLVFLVFLVDELQALQHFQYS